MFADLPLVVGLPVGIVILLVVTLVSVLLMVYCVCKCNKKLLSYPSSSTTRTSASRAAYPQHHHFPTAQATNFGNWGLPDSPTAYHGRGRQPVSNVHPGPQSTCLGDEQPEYDEQSECGVGGDLISAAPPSYLSVVADTGGNYSNTSLPPPYPEAEPTDSS